MTSTTVTQERGAGLLLRAVYFIFFGLWLSGLWAAIAWVLCVTVIGLPFGLWMLNRLPQVTTLAPQRTSLVVDGAGRVYTSEVPQVNFLLRAIYFVLIGWWFSALWLGMAWALCTIIIGMPIGFWMFDRVPAIITLRRG
jgi:uncharacterized membrane protein YccF (DUF307 family)